MTIRRHILRKLCWMVVDCWLSEVPRCPAATRAMAWVCWLKSSVASWLEPSLDHASVYGRTRSELPTWSVSIFVDPTLSLCSEISNIAMVFTAQCTLVHMHGLGIACRLSVRLSVCLSVTLVDCDHIGWKSWKLIARTISPTPSLFVAKRRST